MDTITKILIIILALSAIWLLLSYISWRITFRRGRVSDFLKSAESPRSSLHTYYTKIRDGVAYVSGSDFEKVYITSHDGFRLAGRLFGEKTAPKAVVILFHGYRSIPENDFSCSFRYYLENGYCLLLVDQRAHGKSGGKSITFGVMERHDCLLWSQYAENRFPDTKIILEGMSMGSATVLMASELDLPKSVCGIIADCGYTSPKEIIIKVLRQMHLSPRFFYPLIRSGARIFGGFDPDSCSACEALKKTCLPVFFIHGEKDGFVPCHMSRNNYEACGGPKTIVTIPDADHGLSYLVDNDKVHTALVGFLESL